MPEKKVSGEMSDGESDQMKEAQDCVLCISTFIYWSFFQMKDGAGVRGWSSGEVVRSMQRMGDLGKTFAVCKQNPCPCTLWEVSIASLSSEFF